MFGLKICKSIQKLALLHPKDVITKNLRQISVPSHAVLYASSNEYKKRINSKKDQIYPYANVVTHKQNKITSRPIENSRGDSVELPEKETEQEFLVRIKNDPDTFGGPLEQEPVYEDDVLEEKRFTDQVLPRQKLRTKQYADLIKGYIRQRKIKEAIDVLEVKMLQEDKVKPEAYIYNLLLGACGRVGYTKKAFSLYNQMKQRGLKAMGGTYTALFNACANSPWPTTDGLSRAKHLYEIMIEKGDQPNDTNYNAMIKAFGRCGDLPLAFSLVDEMAQKKFRIKADTMNFLLQACISDKEAGFRHALLVWRKLVEKKISPDVYTFNLLLRSVRDCGLGDLQTTQDVINKLVNQQETRVLLESPQVLKLENNAILEITQESASEGTIETPSNLSTQSLDPNSIEKIHPRPNLLALKPHLGNILSLSEVKNPEDRLLLLGGCQGFLETMLNFKCTPDIKTFSQLLDSIPGTNAAEKQLIIAMKKLNVKPDIDFYNMLIKKKSMRCDYNGAKEVLISMKQMKFRPDLVTYGVLAIGCKTKEEALELINEMKSASYSLNSVILGAMLQQACFHGAFDYIFEIMELCLKEHIPVDKKFVELLDKFKARWRAKLAAKELNHTQEKLFGIFRARYKTWLTEIHIDETEDAHPWQQYKETYPEDKPVMYKEKDTGRFKPRHKSLFKVKTSQKHKKTEVFSG